MSFYHKRQAVPRRFRLILSSFMQHDGLPFSEALPEAEIERAFAEEDALFAQDEDAIYTPAITLWAFLSQVLHKGEQRSCLAAVARVITLLVALGKKPCAENSGAYCRAQAKLSEPVLERLALETALLRQLFGQLDEGDILLADRYYCSYFMIARNCIKKGGWRN